MLQFHCRTDSSVGKSVGTESRRSWVQVPLGPPSLTSKLSHRSSIYIYIYIYLKIEYQSETDFIYHENLRFKKKEKRLRKIKESKRMTKTQGNMYKITKQSEYSRKKKVA